MDLFLDIFTKVFFILSPFFSVSMFLLLSGDMDRRTRNYCALRTSVAILVICFVVYFFGNLIFKVLGITVPAFQVGAGTLLFLTAISMVSGKRSEIGPDRESDFAVVPLAIPMIVGPGTIGTVLVLGMEIGDAREKAIAAAAILLAVLMISLFLFLAVPIGRLLGQKGLQMMMKLTGLILTAIAAQIIFTGVRALLSIPPI
ncbi:MAG: MarC family protein [Sedimentisphaerales bacterium]|jgi:multiple antibiotic resistance protein|nr:MarC family protein [Sedimentisphaerales bacterium]HNY79000.1 MarC family protein [Sedimentisphaerales bacterium]HOC64051.1 MarC family protein [Sedimentisphaerales bacterium]HOH64914.1 MarC family protein [Sedimentisphaerales bacterium]HQA90653.1 MarC family protein [Sedimentisphaerales bacterium]